MEPVGLGLGVAGLMGLFSTCVQLLEQLDSVRNLGIDYQVTIIKHENNKFLLKRWGKSVGLATGALEVSHHPKLDDDDTRVEVYKTLAGIQTLFTDVGKLEEKYGLIPTTYSTTSGATVESSVGLLLQTAKKAQNQSSLRRKVVWAITDKKKFEGLVGNVGTLISGLFSIIPLPDDQLEELRASLSGETKALASKVTNLMDKLDQRSDDAKREELLNWLKATHTENVYFQAINMRHPGTCEWVLQLDQFRGWKLKEPNTGTPADTKVLWIHGGPGVGKTYLSATVVEHLEQVSSYPIAYHFCAHDDDSKRTTTSILRSWIWQLASSNTIALNVLKSSRIRRVSSEPTESELWASLETILAKLGPCYLLVDGFDECTDNSPLTETRAQFLSQLLRSAESGSARQKSARILIVSRDEPDIRTSLISTTSPGVVQYKITREDIGEDLMLFAQGTVDKILTGTSTHTELSKKIAVGLFILSGGIFLLIKLMTPYLQPGKTSDELWDSISRTPPGLEKLYERDLNRIRRMVEEEKQRAEDILRWMLFSTRPLSVSELAVALQVKDGIGSLSQLEKRIPNPLTDEFIEYRILRLCGAFVEIRPDPSKKISEATAHFPHFSVKQFLLRTVEFRDHQKHHGQLATICLNFLSYRDFGKPPTMDKIVVVDQYTPYPFFSYATRTWSNHARDFRKPPPMDKKEVIEEYIPYPFFDYASKTWIYHAREYDDYYEDLLPALKRFALNQNKVYYSAWLNNTGREDIGALLNMCRDGLYSATKYLLENGSDANTKGKNHGTALHSAALSGNGKVVKLLLEHGAKMQSKSTMYTGCLLGIRPAIPSCLYSLCKALFCETPLHIAAFHGHIEVAELLLDAGARVNSKSFVGTPLHMAVLMGRKMVIELLLDRGASPSASNWFTGPPVNYSVFLGRQEILELLVDKGASINHRIFRIGTILHIAIIRGNEELVEYLLNKGANTEIWGLYFPTPLQTAINKGNHKIVELLLIKGANPDSWRWPGGTILGNLISRPDAKETMVELLLKYGADISFKFLYYGNVRVLAEFYKNERFHDLLEKAIMKDPSTDPSQHPYSLER